MTLRTLNYGNYGIFLIMGNAGFCPSAVVISVQSRVRAHVAVLHPEPSLSKFPSSPLSLQEGDPRLKRAKEYYRGLNN